MNALATPPIVPVGHIKCFGAAGDAYEVGRPLRPEQNGDWWVEITLVKTGEKAEYLLSAILDDPEAE
jgi:hypothetical protein